MSLAPNDPRHGTRNGYANLGCRCDACREASTAYCREHGTGGYAMDACACGQPKRVPSEQCRACYAAGRTPIHGTESAYTNRGCRCAACRAAAARARGERRRANLEASRAYNRAYKRQQRTAA